MYYSPLNIIQRNFYKIQKSKIKRAEYIRLIKGKPVITKEIYDHYCLYQFEIYTESSVLIKEIDRHDLDKFVNGRHFNKNYRYNQNTMLAELQKEAAEYVIKYNQKGAQ